jgi:hypothetical protein
MIRLLGTVIRVRLGILVQWVGSGISASLCVIPKG